MENVIPLAPRRNSRMCPDNEIYYTISHVLARVRRQVGSYNSRRKNQFRSRRRGRGEDANNARAAAAPGSSGRGFDFSFLFLSFTRREKKKHRFRPVNRLGLLKRYALIIIMTNEPLLMRGEKNRALSRCLFFA